MSNKYTVKYLTEYEKWDKFVNEATHGTIFHKSYFIKNLAEYTNNSFSIAVVLNADNKIIAGMAFAHSVKFKKIKFIYGLPLTPFYGPIIAERGTKYNTKNERFNTEIITLLINFIEKDFKIL